MSMFRKPKPEAPLLLAADRMVNSTRQGSYGDPVANHERIARVWSEVLRHPVTAEQVALCMAAMKVVRAGGRTDRDDLVDGVCYLDIADRCRNGK